MSLCRVQNSMKTGNIQKKTRMSGDALVHDNWWICLLNIVQWTSCLSCTMLWHCGVGWMSIGESTEQIFRRSWSWSRAPTEDDNHIHHYMEICVFFSLMYRGLEALSPKKCYLFYWLRGEMLKIENVETQMLPWTFEILIFLWKQDFWLYFSPRTTNEWFVTNLTFCSPKSRNLAWYWMPTLHC